MIDLLTLPLLACITLVGIHVYFGAFVLKRGIIFIDIALAQWACLGYVVAYWLGIHQGPLFFIVGVAFSMIAALILSLVKPLYNQVNLQEAVIGVLYIAGAALTVGILSSTGMEGQHLTKLFSGQLLFVSGMDVIWSALLYLVIGGIVYKYHSRFSQSGTPLWNFIFYALFGCVVTSSVKMVGILLVFSYLVLPVLSLVLFTNQLKHQIRWGWVIGSVASLIGLGASIIVDIPPSYCIILVLCTGWLAMTKIGSKRT